jgi:membrane protein DedA with SNARE-associated domain
VTGELLARAHAARVRVVVGAALLGAVLVVAHVLDLHARVPPLLASARGLGPAGVLVHLGVYLVAALVGLPLSPVTLAAGATYGALAGAAIAVPGITIASCAAFLVGRHFGSHVTERFPRLGAAVPRVDQLLKRWRWIAVIALRFMYGLRIAGPVLIGAGTMPAWEFVAANALGAVLWAAIIGGLGYVAGHAVERMLGEVVHAEKLLLVIVAIIAVVVFVVHTVARRRARRAGR